MTPSLWRMFFSSTGLFTSLTTVTAAIEVHELCKRAHL